MMKSYKYHDDATFDINDVGLMHNSIAFYLFNHPQKTMSQHKYNQIVHVQDILNKSLMQHTTINVKVNQTKILTHTMKYLDENYTKYSQFTQFMNNTNQTDAVVYMPKQIHQLYLKVRKYSAMCIAHATTPQRLLATLDKVNRFAQHSFVQESLDLLFKGLTTDKKKGVDIPNTLLCGFALDVVHDFNHHHFNTRFIIVNSAIVGISHQIKTLAKNDKDTLHMCTHHLHIYQKLSKQGIKYVIGKFDDNNKIIALNKVRAKNVKKLTKMIKRYIVNDIKPQYRHKLGLE